MTYSASGRQVLSNNYMVDSIVSRQSSPIYGPLNSIVGKYLNF